MNKKVNKKYDYPENRELRSLLKYGDKRILAEKSGLSYITVVNILEGKRQLPDRLKKAIIELVNDRKSLNNGLKTLAEEK